MKMNILFLENFAQLLNQGYTVEQALTLSHQIFNLSFYEDYIHSLSKGDDIYDLLISGNFPVTFKNYLSFYRNKGHLSDAIIKSLRIYNMQNKFINKLKKQLTYPLFLILFLFIFSLFILLFLLPQIDVLFRSFDIKTNIFTSLMFLFFRLFPLFFIIFSSFLIIVLLYLFYGIKKKKHKIIDLFINNPFTGLLLKKYFSLKFALFYNELSLDYIDAATIIDLLNEQMCDDDIKIILYEMKKLLMQGEHIEDILQKLKYFDPLLISFFKISFYNINKKDAINFYIDATFNYIETYIDKYIKLIIPVVYCFVSFFVVGIYISIIIPLMSGFSNI